MDVVTYIKTAETIAKIVKWFSSVYVWVSHRLGKCPKRMEIHPLSKFITSKLGNSELVSGAEFLSWRKCAIMLWVYVTPLGKGVRREIDHVYILSHLNGDLLSKKQKNLFAMRYSSARNWELAFTNSDGLENPRTLILEDKLQEGWCQFLVTWDKDKPLLKFGIYGQENLIFQTNDFENDWVTKPATQFIVGSWLLSAEGKTPFHDSYCETRVKDLWICERFIKNENDFFFKMHRNHKPTEA